MLGRSSSSPVGVVAALRGDGGFPAGGRRGSGGGRRGSGGPAVYEDEEEGEEDLEAGYQVEGEEEDEDSEDEGGNAAGKRGRAPGCRGSAGGATAAGIGSGWAIYVVLFVFQLTVPSILWSYGVLMTWMIESGDVQLPIALWTPALFSATYCLVDPWVRWPATRGSSGRRTKVSAPWVLRPLAIAGILITTTSLFVTPFFPTRDYCLLTYGVLAGLGSSMAVAQSELALDHRFPPRKRRYRKRVFSLCIIRVACSISQITSPLILMGLVNAFGRRYAPMLHAGIVLQALVAALLLRQRRAGNLRRAVRLANMSYSIMEEDDAESGWNCSGRTITAPEGENLLPFEEDLAGRSWKNPARDDATAFDARDDDDDMSSDEPLEQPAPDAITSLLQQPRRRNCYGVEILPQIPEETEDEDSREGADWQEKRLSRRLTLTIPNINNNHSHNNNNNDKGLQPPSPDSQSTPCYPNGNSSYTPDTPSSTSSTTFLISPNGGGPAKWKRWKWKRRKWRGRRRRRSRTLSGGSSCRDDEEEDADADEEDHGGQRSWRKELERVVSWRGLTKASFYPSLALSASSRLAGMAFFTLLPLVARRMGRTNNDAVLLLAIAGFCSVLVSAATSWISYPAARRRGKEVFEPRCCRKIVYCVGSIASAIAFFLLSRAEWYGKLTLAAILFGIGSGATADTSSSLLRTASAGSTSIDGSRGLMCTLTAFIILGCTGLLDVYTGRSPIENTIGSHITSLPGATSLSICFSIIAIIQFLAGIAWCIQPVLSRFYQRQRHFAGWSPGMFLQTA
ncbi:uncharacterized protein LOC124162199 [Ischnura elegans]|uniref:uncharacterized protein LOC124162199 n=1 Tax=Ischnura elegans TaxID=197161 RepID=UPI001ED888A1|nr:uncharacterized protein LOC124162199 [Ischnura elegans]